MSINCPNTLTEIEVYVGKQFLQMLQMRGKIMGRKISSYWKTCSYCSKKNHFATVCRKRKHVVSELRVGIEQVFGSDSVSSTYILWHCSQYWWHGKKKSWFKTLLVVFEVNSKLDIGADNNIYPFNIVTYRLVQ